MAPVFCCGLECGQDQQGAGSSTFRHWNTRSTAGGLTIETAAPLTGTRSLRVIGDAAGPYMQASRGITGKDILVVRYRFKVLTLPSGQLARTCSFQLSTSACSIQVSSGAVLQARFGGNTQNGPTLSTNDIVEIECRYNGTSNPNTLDWSYSLNGGTWTDGTQVTLAQVATTCTNIQFGITNGASSSYGEFLIDDVAVWDASGDYGKQSGEVYGYSPNVDGTHSFTAGDFGYDTAGGDVATSATDVYTYIDDKAMTGTADLIRQKVIRSTGYIEVGFENTDKGAPRAVELVAALHAAGVGANTQTLKLTDDDGTSLVDAYTNLDCSDVTLFWAAAHYAVAPSTAVWTQALFNALKARWGYSTDVTDIPYLDGLMLEAEFSPSGPPAESPAFIFVNRRRKIRTR